MLNSVDNTLLPKNNEQPRQRIERWIEYLIDCLDGIDTDPDLEGTSDYEPYLSIGASYWSTGGYNFGSDREANGPEYSSQWKIEA